MEIKRFKDGSSPIALLKVGLREIAMVDMPFAFLSNFNWSVSKSRGLKYALHRKTINNKITFTYMHRVVAGALPGQVVDHINGDTLDNRKSNLRICSISQNGANRGKNKDNTSGYKGVTFHKGTKKWQAGIKIKGKYIYIGRFDDPALAASAYDKAAKEIHGEFAWKG